MSRYYGMSVRVSGHVKEKAEAIAAALAEEWPSLWENLENQLDADELSAYGEDRLCGGEMEDEFAARVAKAAWTANGEYCAVNVNCTCLEDLPFESYDFDEERYDELMEKSSS
jgi:hypothetical protein